MVNQQRLHDVLVHMCSKLEQNCHTNAGVGVYKVVQNQARSFGEVEERERWYSELPINRGTDNSQLWIIRSNTHICVSLTFALIYHRKKMIDQFGTMQTSVCANYGCCELSNQGTSKSMRIMGNSLYINFCG